MQSRSHLWVELECRSQSKKWCSIERFWMVQQYTLSCWKWNKLLWQHKMISDTRKTDLKTIYIAETYKVMNGHQLLTWVTNDNVNNKRDKQIDKYAKLWTMFSWLGKNTWAHMHHPTTNISMDALHYPTSGLVTQANSLTLVHHASSGLSTLIPECTRVMYWFHVQWIKNKPSLKQAFWYQATSDLNFMVLLYAKWRP